MTRVVDAEVGDATARARRIVAWRAPTFAILIAAIGAIAYSNGLTGEFVGIDTKRHVRDNEDVHSLWPLWRAMSLHLVGEEAAKSESTLVRRPILSLSLALNHVLLGPGALGFQAVNIAIHIAAALVLFGVVRRSLDLRGVAPPRADALAFVVASLWVAHPLNTSSVMHVVQRAESMMGLFALLTVYGTVRAARASSPRDARGWKTLAVVACALGMGTKEIMIVVPPLIWIYRSILLDRGYVDSLRANRKFYGALASTWLLFVAFLPFTIEYTAHDFQAEHLWPYWLSQPRVVLHYLRLVLWPDPLHQYILAKSFWFDANNGSWLEIVPYLLAMAAIAGVSVWLILSRHPWGVTCAFIFLPLLPTSVSATFNVIQEHRMYLSVAGVLSFLVIGVGWGLDRLLASRHATRIARILALASIGAAIVLTRARNEDYRSEMTVWAPEDLPVAFTMLSGLAMWDGRYVESDELFQRLIELSAQARPGEPLATMGVAARNGLGVSYVLQNRYDDAVLCFEEALRRDPTYGAAHNNMAAIRLLRGDREGAREYLRAAIGSDPNPAVAHYNAAVLAILGREQATARRHLEIADAKFPWLARMGETLVSTPLSPRQNVRLVPVLAPADERHVMRFKIALAIDPMS